MKQKILLFVSISLLSFSLWARSSNPMSAKLLLDLRITTALYEAGVENVELNEDELLAIEDEEWINAIQETGTQILKEHQVSDSKIKEINWKKAAKSSGTFIIKIYKKFRSNSRLNGVDVGIVYLLGKPIENYIIPMVLAEAGLPVLAAASFFVPTSAIITGGYSLLKKFFHQRKIKKMYGDKNVFRFYKELEEKIEKELHLGKDDTYLIPARKIDDQVVLIAVNKSRNIGSHKLTFSKAYAYALDHGISSSELKFVRKLGEKKLMRLILLVEKLYSSQSDEWLNNFETHFSDSVALVNNLESTKELRLWARGIQNVKNCQELRTLIQVSPNGHSSREIFSLVKNVFIPTMADTVTGWKTGMFKRIRKGLEKIEISINLEQNPVWDSAQFTRMDSMLDQACR